MSALPQQGDVTPEVGDQVRDWLRTTTTKFLRIGAGLREFLRFTEKIVFSKEPYHTPDPKFVEELTAMLKKIEEEQPGRLKG